MYKRVDHSKSHRVSLGIGWGAKGKRGGHTYGLVCKYGTWVFVIAI
jgi:hypothetical protein